MKKLIWQTLPALCVAGMMISVRAQDNPAAAPDTNPDTVTTPDGAPVAVPDATAAPDAAAADAGLAAPDMPMPADNGGGNVVREPNGRAGYAGPAMRAAADDLPAGAMVHNSSTDTFVPPSKLVGNPDQLRLNFKNAPLDEVLNFLSDAAGFIIEMDTPVHGSVTVMSSSPMTRDEAVDLLNDVLNKNGYAAIRDGRKLTIVDKNDAKTRHIPVKVGNDPDKVANNAEIVTQIIPIRFVEAGQLTKDLSLFVSPQATIVANDAGNSIVITDTQSNIKHLLEIIKAIDSSAEGETQIKVFHLSHANPTDVANELAQIFPSSTGSGGGAGQAPTRFAGGGGGRGGGGSFGGGGGGAGGPGAFFAALAGGGAAAGAGSNARMQKQTQVLAVADLRTSSVIVTASADLMAEITGMMAQLDIVSERDQKPYVFHLDHGDPAAVLQALQGMFGGNSSTSRGGSSSSSSTSALQTRETQNASSTGSSSSTGIGGGGGGIGGGGGGGGRAGGF